MDAELIRQFMKRDKFAEFSGIELLEVGPGRAKARLAVGEQHLNGVGLVHGGAIFTLADLAFAAACNSHGTIAVAINASISFINAARGGTLVAEAEEVAVNPKLGTYRVIVRNEDGGIVASFEGMAYRKKDSIPV
ncbi:MAG TPA: hotdog fold thioesterase [Planctomycetota bacterium]|nr:hotdog fold thioesterase [Planctomycetota bacterium]